MAVLTRQNVVYQSGERSAAKTCKLGEKLPCWGHMLQGHLDVGKKV